MARKKLVTPASDGARQTRPPSRMAKHRLKRRKAGEKQITAYLSPEASSLLADMMRFSGNAQGRLLSDAVCALALDYEYWGLREPDEYGDSDVENSHFENFYTGQFYENPRFERKSQQPVPPWIIEHERLMHAEREALEKQLEQPGGDAAWREGLSVYRRGVRRVTGDGS